MRLLTWNCRAGRASAAWPAIARDADLIFLQEVRPPDERAAFIWDAVPGRAWGSALVARRGRIAQIPLTGYEGWVVGGLVTGLARSGRWRECYAFSVHVPSPGNGRKRASYFRESIAIARKLRRLVGRSATLVLGGDFNIAMAKREAGDPLSRTRTEHRTLDTIASRPIGLVSLWPACHPGKAPAQTLRWTTNPTAPYHCDGFFVPAALTEGAACEVIDTPQVHAASDHNPVTARVA